MRRKAQPGPAEVDLGARTLGSTHVNPSLNATKYYQVSLVTQGSDTRAHLAIRVLCKAGIKDCIRNLHSARAWSVQELSAQFA